MATEQTETGAGRDQIDARQALFTRLDNIEGLTEGDETRDPALRRVHVWAGKGIDRLRQMDDSGAMPMDFAGFILKSLDLLPDEELGDELVTERDALKTLLHPDWKLDYKDVPRDESLALVKEFVFDQAVDAVDEPISKYSSTEYSFDMTYRIDWAQIRTGAFEIRGFEVLPSDRKPGVGIRFRFYIGNTEFFVDGMAAQEIIEKLDL